MERRRRWGICRAMVPYADGQRRWDRAYQLLLYWTAAQMSPPQEAEDDGRSLRPGLEPAARTGWDD